MTKKQKANTVSDQFLTITDVLEQRKITEKVECYYSEMFQKNIKIDDIAKSLFFEIIADKTGDEFDKYSKLIYNSCSFFRSTELIKALGCDNPYDVVKAVFGDNIAEFIELGNLILKKYGFSGDKVEEIKK